jgi:hypothetical protein
VTVASRSAVVMPAATTVLEVATPTLATNDAHTESSCGEKMKAKLRRMIP